MEVGVVGINVELDVVVEERYIIMFLPRAVMDGIYINHNFFYIKMDVEWRNCVEKLVVEAMEEREG